VTSTFNLAFKYVDNGAPKLDAGTTLLMDSISGKTSFSTSTMNSPILSSLSQNLSFNVRLFSSIHVFSSRSAL